MFCLNLLQNSREKIAINHCIDNLLQVIPLILKNYQQPISRIGSKTFSKQAGDRNEELCLKQSYQIILIFQGFRL